MPSDAYEWAEFSTPTGVQARIAYRPSTVDWNNVFSVVTEDEYMIPDDLTGWALDIGAHVGSATVAMALMNPSLHVIAVEPLPENLEMLRLNVEANGLADRVVVVEGAVGGTTIGYGFDDGSEQAYPHRYIGNAWAPGWVPKATVEATGYDLDALLALAGVQRFAFCKIDCEGGEWGFLADDCDAIDTIVGEWHPVDDHVRGDLLEALGGTHWLTFSGPVDGPGGFRAVHV